MKRIATMLAVAFTAVAVMAQTPQQMLDRVSAAIKAAGTVTANYKMTSKQGNSSGNITLSGSKYCLMSNDVKCWYNGITLWTYSTATGEVNITTPTAADLQSTNPYAALQDFKRNYNMKKGASKTSGCYALILTPKARRGQIKQMCLYIDQKTNLVREVSATMSNGTAYNVTLTGYKTGVRVPDSKFTFNKSLVPPGTEVVDLR